MKKLMLIALIILGFGCKKSNVGSDITKYYWPLKSATISPALLVDGKLITDYMTLSGPSSCLNNNFKLSFENDGSFAFSSNGPLCDMISYEKAKWTQEGEKIILDSGVGEPSFCILKNNVITSEGKFTQDNKEYTVTYIYLPERK